MKIDSNEKLISNALLELLRVTEARDSAFIKEKVIANFSRRADLVVANGSLSAYEIKSSADSLVRLSGQTATFLENFEKVSVVCAVKHLASIRKLLGSSRVGLFTITSDGIIDEIRRPRYARITKNAWLGHLTVQQLIRLLRQNGVVSSDLNQDRAALINLAMSLRYSQVRRFALESIKQHNTRIELQKEKRSKALEMRKALFANDPYLHGPS